MGINVSRATAYVELVKPGIVLWVLITVAAGFYLASPDAFANLLLFHALLGTVLLASGCNTLNQVVERESDALMRRTRHRPVPSGRVSVGAALGFGGALSIAGVAYFAVFTNAVATACAVATLVLYVLVYTPLKRQSSLSTLVGAIPGALPILGGWAATGRGLGPAAWALFGLLFLWQLPHFLALAWLYREDYARAGFKMLSVTNGRDATFRQAILYGVALLPVSVVPNVLGLTGPIYLGGALALCLWLIWAAVRAARDQAPARTWRLFAATVLYLPAMLGLMVIDKVG
jgi:protoheme IX farnesyltransferase